jgi:hypothetical protein
MVHVESIVILKVKALPIQNFLAVTDKEKQRISSGRRSFEAQKKIILKHPSAIFNYVVIPLM